MTDIESSIDEAITEVVCDEEQPLESIEQGDVPKGILYEYSLKLAQRLEKRQKLEGVFQFIKYALCAASAGIIQIVLFAILQAAIPKSGETIHFIVEDMDLITFIATTVALCASILWNFTFNRKFTFKDASNVPKAMILAFLFYVPFYPFQTWYVYTIKELLVEHIGSDGAGIIAEGTVMVINFALEFIWQKFVVFRKPKEIKEEAAEDTEAQESLDMTEAVDTSEISDVAEDIEVSEG